MMNDQNCIFCKIVTKEAPASIVYEDEEIISFMNIRPVHEGECLVIPKKHVDHFIDIEDKLSQHIISIGQLIAHKIMEEIKPERVGYVVAGYSVPHAHLIIIPQYHTHDITCQHFAILQDGEIQFTDQHIPLASRENLDDIASRLKI